MLKAGIAGAYALVMVFTVFSTQKAGARALDPIDPAELTARMGELSYEPWSGSASEPDTTADCEETKRKIEIKDPRRTDSRSIEISIYRPNANKKVPVLLVVPSMNGVTAIEPKIASELCAAGFGAVIADVVDTAQPKNLPAAGHEDRQTRRAVLALRTVLDYVSTEAAFDRDRLGIVGISLGGIITSVMAGIEPDRLKAVVIVVGGGNLPFVLANSDNSKVTELRRRRMKNLNLKDAAAYEDWLRGNLRFDPMYFATRARTDRIMMITAKSDVKVPYSVQTDLFNAFGKPNVSEYSGGHLETIIGLTYFYFSDVTDFLNVKFGISFNEPPRVIHH